MVLNSGLNEIRNKLINKAILAMFIFMIPAFVGSLMRIRDIGWNYIFLFHAIFILCVVPLFVFRKKLNLNLKIHTFSILLLLIAVVGLMQFRLAGGWYIVFVLITILALVKSIKTVVVYFSIFFLFFIGVWFGHVKGVLYNPIDFNAYMYNNTAWVSYAVGLLLSFFVLVYTVGLYVQLFSNTILSLSKKSNELQETLVKLKNSDERFRSFINNNPFPISIKDKNLNFIFVNKAIEQASIKQHDVSTESKSRDIFDEEVSGELDSLDRAVLKDKTVQVKDVQGLIDGVPQYFRVVKFPLIGINGDDEIGTLAIKTTEQKVAEKMMLDSERKYRAMFDSSLNGFVFTDNKSEIIDYNKAFAKLLGFKKVELLGKTFPDFISERNCEKLNEFLDSSFKDKQNYSAFFEDELKHKSGKLIPVEINLYKLILNNESFFWLVIRDITQQKNMDKKIYEAGVEVEEEERERYAKELHDGLGPILSTCIIYINSLSQLAEESKKMEFTQLGLNLLHDAVQIVKEISNNLSPVMLQNYGVEQAIRSFVAKLKKGTDIEFRVDSNLKNRLVDLVEITLYRTVTELINNTVKYAKATKVNIHINHGQEKLIVHYSDNGKGFDLDKVKREKKGFGLINIENRINKIGGKCDYQSKVNKGVDVIIVVDNMYLY